MALIIYVFFLAVWLQLQYGSLRAPLRWPVGQTSQEAWSNSYALESGFYQSCMIAGDGGEEFKEQWESIP